MQKQISEETLHISEVFMKELRGMQFPQLFNHLPEVYFVVKDHAGRVIMANSVAVRMCGFKHEEEMIGKTDYDLFTQDRADIYVKDDQHVLKTGESIIDQVEMAPDPDNSISWFVTTKIPLYSHKNEIMGLACIARSMTEAYEKLRPYAEMNGVLAYVRKNHAQPIKLDDLAQIANLSLSQFDRRFRKVFHITPTKHILHVRIRSACNLLTKTDSTIASIALDSGFYDHSHFIHNFKKVMRLSPSAYRKQGGANQR